jgi:hypothetical protein
MPRLKNAVPKYRKHKQSGQGIVTLSGRDFLLGPHATKASHLEYDRLIMEWLASGRSPSLGTASRDLLIAELVVDHVQHAKDYYGSGPNSELHRIRRVVRRVRRYGRTPAAGFGVLHLKPCDRSLSRNT